MANAMKEMTTKPISVMTPMRPAYRGQLLLLNKCNDIHMTDDRILWNDTAIRMIWYAGNLTRRVAINVSIIIVSNIIIREICLFKLR